MSTIILDCDGVLLDLMSAVLKAIDSTLTTDDITDWNFFGLIEAREGPAKRQQALDVCNSSGGVWTDAEPYPNITTGLERLRSISGARVLVATSPWHTCPTWGFERYQWLKRHLDFNVEDIIIARAKHLITGDYFLDDKTETVLGWQTARSYASAFLLDRPWNRNNGVEAPTRTNWMDFVRHVEDFER